MSFPKMGHSVFNAVEKKTFDHKERRGFKRYFLSTFLLLILPRTLSLKISHQKIEKCHMGVGGRKVPNSDTSFEWPQTQC
jgi:hypothetical protein